MQPFNDVPPPPYSETDIYSHAGGHPTNTARLSVGHLSPLPSQHGDDAFSTSTSGDVIYTPPLTPQTSHSRPVEPSAAAAAYFDTRPAPDVVPAQLIEHTLTVTASSTPEDFPITDFPSRDVTQQDWRTFLNFLLPDHTARRNEAVADRKLRAEGSDASTSGDAEAQISAIRSENGSTGQSRQDIERTVEEWNVWFFSPRGVRIHLTPEADASRMPGAWDHSFDSTAPAGPSNPQSNPPNPQPPTGTGPCPSPTNARGFNFGGIRISDEGVSLGNNLVADRNGIRVGQFTADHSGIKYAGRNLLPGAGFAPFPPHRGGGWSHYGPLGGRHPGYGPFGAHPRGHHYPPGPHGHHLAASVSSEDNSSNSSSSDSDDDGSSIGSLPDYDELDRQQFTVYSETLQAWLSRSGGHISKQDIRQLKTQLRAVRSKRGDLKPDERKACTVEIKGLMRQLKQVIKQQKQERKELKRKEKQRKRAEKKERREKKRELKRARRDHARGRVGAVPPIPPVPPVPASPAAAPVPPTPPAPPAPPTPHAVPMIDPMGFMGRCSPGGRGRGFGEGCGSRGMGGGPWGNRHGPGGPFGAGQFGAGPWGMGASRGGFPGAWPDNRGLEFSEGRLNGYNKAIDKLEKKIEQRETELSKLEIEMASGNHGRGWVAKKAESKKVALEKEIEDIQSALEHIRLQADEEYARIVEARENASY